MGCGCGGRSYAPRSVLPPKRLQGNHAPISQPPRMATSQSHAPGSAPTNVVQSASLQQRRAAAANRRQV
jgi:hypothetical protein